MDCVKSSTGKEEEREQLQPTRQYSSPSKRKTRDLPDLYNCHGCKFHVSNIGQDKLHILTSEWRIVLLCNMCFVLVKTAKICSYCFLQTTKESFRCLHCARMIHRDCVLQCRCFAPWSYSSFSGVDFSICVDCWIPPKLLSNSRSSSTADFANKIRRNIEIADSAFLARKKPISRPSRNLKDAVIDVKRVAKQKIADVSIARGNGLEKAKDDQRAVEFTTDGLEREGHCGAEDSDLTFPLLHALNSSPRRSKNAFSVRSRCLPAQRLITDSDAGTSSATNEGCQCSVNDEGKNEALPLKEEEGSCSDKMMNVSNGCNNNSMESEAYSCGNDMDDGIKDELCTCDIRCGCQFKAPEDHAATEKPEISPDKFSKVYCRRRRRVHKINLPHPSSFMKLDLPHPAMFIYQRFGNKTQ